MSDLAEIQSRDFWFKVIDMLQQNWALIEHANNKVTVFFLSDNGGIFDQLSFLSTEEAKGALRFNGFARLSEDSRASSFLRSPETSFVHRHHPNGPIYSSGRFWKTP